MGKLCSGNLFRPPISRREREKGDGEDEEVSLRATVGTRSTTAVIDGKLADLRER